MIRASWIINAIVLLGSLLWVLSDGKFAYGVAVFKAHISAIGSDRSPLAVVTPLMWPRVDALWVILIAGTLSGIGIVAGLIAGAGQHRNVRSWLAVMLLAAGWLTLLTTWPQIAWQGQVWRVRGAIAGFEDISQALLADWPKTDGDFEGLGQFMAYPIGKPRTLMFVATPTVPNTNLSISVVERGGDDLSFEMGPDGKVIEHQGDDGLHFQLAGSEEGVWLVRQEGAGKPQSFFSGLEGEYMPIKYRLVKPRWYLVRYHYAPIVPAETPHIGIPRR